MYGNPHKWGLRVFWGDLTSGRSGGICSNKKYTNVTHTHSNIQPFSVGIMVFDLLVEEQNRQTRTVSNSLVATRFFWPRFHGHEAWKNVGKLIVRMWCCWKYTKHIQFGSENWERKRTERPSLMGNLGPTFKDRPSWWLVNWATFINQSLGYVTSWLFITNVTIFQIPVYPSYLITTLIYVAFYNWEKILQESSQKHTSSHQSRFYFILQLRPTGFKNQGALGGVLCAAIILSKLQAYGRSFPHSHVKEEENMNSLFF